MWTSRIAVSLAAFVLLSAPPTQRQAAAQPGVSASRYYEPGTTWQKHQSGTSACAWSGREPDGALVYAWETDATCGRIVGAYGYDVNADGAMDLYVWPNPPSNCGAQIHIWQWTDRGHWTERVNGECIRLATGQLHFVYNYYTVVTGATCESALTFLRQRQRDAMTAFNAAAQDYNRNRLAVKALWHAVNKANLTLQACTNALAAGRR